MEIRPINFSQIEQQVRRQQATGETQNTLFSDMMNQALQAVNETDSAAKSSQVELLTGESPSIHNVVLAAEKADLALQLTLQIRNKVLDAYNEVMRMQI